jgi:hypothetical protein
MEVASCSLVEGHSHEARRRDNHIVASGDGFVGVGTGVEGVEGVDGVDDVGNGGAEEALARAVQVGRRRVAVRVKEVEVDLQYKVLNLCRIHALTLIVAHHWVYRVSGLDPSVPENNENELANELGWDMGILAN